MKSQRRKLILTRSILLSLLAALLVFTPKTFALSSDMLDFFAENGIYYFDPSGYSNGPCIGSRPSEIGTGDNASIIASYLVAKGYSREAAAAVIGNLVSESSLNPRVIEGGTIVDEDFIAYKDGAKTFSGGFGIAQWTSAGRVQALQQYADDSNLPVASFDAQVGFLAKELGDKGYTPSTANARTLEENVFWVAKVYEAPAAMIYTDHNGVHLNDRIPSSLSDLDPVETKSAYNSYQARLLNAKSALGLSISDVSSFTACSASAWVGDFPVYYQNDPQWGGLTYGPDGIYGTNMATSSTIGDAGCGPTSFAMLATALLGREILPSETADVAGRLGQYVKGSGSSWTITKVLASHYGLTYEKISASSGQEAIDKISQYLRDGWMIHSSGGPNCGGSGAAPYSTSGHYIGIRAVTAEGKWLIADSARGRDNAKEWNPNDVISAGLCLANINAIKK